MTSAEIDEAHNKVVDQVSVGRSLASNDEGCESEELDNCFICQSFDKLQCIWDNGQCKTSNMRRLTKWWQTFEGCDDYLDLCRSEVFNSTFKEYSIEYN